MKLPKLRLLVNIQLRMVIRDAKDIVSDEGDAYIVPHMSHSHWIPKSDLSEEERQATQAFCAEKGITAGTESKTPEKKAQDTASSSALKTRNSSRTL